MRCSKRQSERDTAIAERQDQGDPEDQEGEKREDPFHDFNLLRYGLKRLRSPRRTAGIVHAGAFLGRNATHPAN